jgi:hypothetical protein
MIDFSHGGDWEGVHVVLNAAGEPDSIWFLGHDEITAVPWSAIHTEPGTRHPLVYVELGGHATFGTPPSGFAPGVKYQSWPGGEVTWGPGVTMPAGPLVNLGEKLHPMQPFVAYSGLWGSPGFNFYGLPNALKTLISAGFQGRPVTNVTSGYWGPAYNETSRRTDGFITAWCAGHREPLKRSGIVRECYADADVP